MGITDSPAKLAILFIVGGIVAVFFILGGSARNVFIGSTSEEVIVQIKQEDTCIVEASDEVPRQISNCPYDKGEEISITYKTGQPSIESHSPAQM